MRQDQDGAVRRGGLQHLREALQAVDGAEDGGRAQLRRGVADGELVGVIGLYVRRLLVRGARLRDDDAQLPQRVAVAAAAPARRELVHDAAHPSDGPVQPRRSRRRGLVRRLVSQPELRRQREAWMERELRAAGGGARAG